MRFVFDEKFVRAPKLNATLAWGAAYGQAASIAIETANKQFELVGTNAADADSLLFAGGGIALSTAGAGADQMIVRPHTDTNQSEMATVTWGSADEITLSWTFRVAAFAGQIICLGMRPAATLAAGATALDTATDNDKFIIRAAQGTDTNFQLIASVGGTETTVDSGVAVSDNTSYKIFWTLAADRTSTIRINTSADSDGRGTSVPIPTALTAATALGVPFFGLQAGGAAVETINLARMRGSALLQST